MKKYLKTFMSALFILFSIGAAFSLHASEGKTGTYGYVTPINGGACSLVVPCNSIGSQACIAIYGGSYYRAFGKIDPNDTACFLVIYRF